MIEATNSNARSPKAPNRIVLIDFFAGEALLREAVVMSFHPLRTSEAAGTPGGDQSAIDAFSMFKCGFLDSEEQKKPRSAANEIGVQTRRRQLPENGLTIIISS